MSGPDLAELYAVFKKCRDLPESQRPRFLDAEVKQDGLRREVERLLQIDSADASFPAAPADLISATVDQPLVTEQPGTQIGPYKLREQIGEGGFGVVYVAQQSKPVRRDVALKIIKPGMDTKDVIARFEAERQALALMDHPNIAKVLDAGTTGELRNADCGLRIPPTAAACDLADNPQSEIRNLQSGRPYFVMELVRGVPITEFCDEQKLATRERLQLFVDVCRAVQHAHQKGIIHRDLKPSNILVTLDDNRPIPKVIDFGIAKALSRQLTDNSIYTAYGQMIGTPLYMSPEQAALSMNDVDTRSDVYSLGVLLYGLLTGTTPFDKDVLRKAGFDEMRRMIREDEPPRPSARVSTLKAETLSTVSGKRKVAPRRFPQSLRGELDWIVMKALEKDRARRYESASAFAADVERYLNDEPVAACPPSVGYRLGKVLRRHRNAAVTVTTVVVAAIGFGSYYFHAAGVLAEANRKLGIEGAEKDRALKKEKEAVGKKDEALADKDAAHRELQIRYSTFLLDRGLAWCADGKVPLGLLVMARSLEAAPADEANLQRVIRTNLAIWSRYVSRLRAVLPEDDYYDEPTFSPHGKTLLTIARPNRAQLWDLATGNPIGEPVMLSKIPRGMKYQFGYVKAIAFTADSRIVSIAAIGGIYRIDATTGKPLGPPLKVSFRRFSTDGRVVATAGRNSKTTQLWDVATGKPIGKPWEGRLVCFSPDNARMLTRGTEVRLRDVTTAAPIGDPLPHPEGLTTGIFDPDGEVLVTASGKRVRFWDAAKGKELGKPIEHAEKVERLGFSLDGKTLVTVTRTGKRSRERNLRLWDATTRKSRGSRASDDNDLIWHGRFVRARYLHGKPHWSQLYEPHRGQPGKPQPPKGATVVDRDNPAGPIVLVESFDGTSQLWNAHTGKAVGALLPYPHAARWPVFSPDHRSYLTHDSTFGEPTWSQKRTAYRVWQVGRGAPPGERRDAAGRNDAQTVIFNSGARFALGGFSGSRGGSRRRPYRGAIYLRDRAGKRLATLQGNFRMSYPKAADFSPDGRLVLARINGPGPLGGGHLWEVKNGTLVPRWERQSTKSGPSPKDRVSSVAFSPDYKRFLVGDGAGKAELRDVATGKLMRTFKHRNVILGLAFSPDGKTILTASADLTSLHNRAGQVQLWDTATGKPIGKPMVQQGIASRSAFNADGTRIVTSSGDNAARLWNVQTRTLVATLAHKGTVTSVRFSRDGQTVLTGSLDGTARLWDAATGKPLGPPLNHDHELYHVSFNDDDTAIFTAHWNAQMIGGNAGLREWKISLQPLEGSTEQITAWVQVITGMERDGNTITGQLSHEAWNERRRRLQELGGPPMPGSQSAQE